MHHHHYAAHRAAASAEAAAYVAETMGGIHMTMVRQILFKLMIWMGHLLRARKVSLRLRTR